MPVSRVRSTIGLIVLVSLLATIAALVGDPYRFSRRLSSKTEVVLRPGMSVTAQTVSGALRIQAGGATTRTLSGPGWSRKLSLVARDTRWGGSLGLYDGHSYGPGAGMVVEEGQIHVVDRTTALRWLTYLSAGDSVVYTRDGLVVAMRPSEDSGSAAPQSIALWQLYVDGHKPADLPLARDEAIAIGGGTIPSSARPHKAAMGYTLEYSGPRAAAAHFGDSTLVTGTPEPR